MGGNQSGQPTMQRMRWRPAGKLAISERWRLDREDEARTEWADKEIGDRVSSAERRMSIGREDLVDIENE